MLEGSELLSAINQALGDSEAFRLQLDVPAGAKIVVAMSGGVDSSVTAGLLKILGYEVIGLTLQLYDHGEAIGRKGACCAGEDIYDAKMVASRLNFPHYVLDRESRFRQAVIEDFADAYARGETPIPCVRCNQTVKFTDLVSFAQELGAAALATGHYVRRFPADKNHNLPRLGSATDRNRDQSYFLFATTPTQLAYLRFPLGGLTKPMVRKLAEILGLAIADKPDSQDICFTAGGDYRKIVKSLRPEAFTAGKIVTTTGEIIGDHQGIASFTIGQRRGIGIGGRSQSDASEQAKDSEPLYVTALDPIKAQVIVGPKQALARHEVRFNEGNWLSDSSLITDLASKPLHVNLRIRSQMKLVKGQLVSLQNGEGRVEFEEPQYGVAAGQACVLYDESGLILLGGGWIQR